MDQVPFIVKPLKVLKSTSGLKEELFHSQKIHFNTLPLLVSSKVLRSRKLGQIDIACINDAKEIVVYEVKSSEQGTYLHPVQYQRLKNALNFLQLIFNLPGKMRVIK